MMAARTRRGNLLNAAIVHESPINGPARMQWRAQARVIEQEVGNEARSARARGGGRAVVCVVLRTGGIRPKTGRHSENALFRQPGEHVAARGIDVRSLAPDDGRIQQSRNV